MDQRIEAGELADKAPSDTDEDKRSHGVITAGQDAHERERPGYTPPADRAENKGGKTSKE